MYGRKYQWIVMGTYRKKWWKKIEPDLNCTLDELEEALQQTILTDLLPLSTSGEITISGIVSELDFVLTRSVPCYKALLKTALNLLCRFFQFCINYHLF